MPVRSNWLARTHCLPFIQRCVQSGWPSWQLVQLTVACCQRNQAVRKSNLRLHAAHAKLQYWEYTERRTPENIYNIWKIPIQLTSVGLAHARPNNKLIWPTIISQNLRPPKSCGWSPFAHAYYFYFELAVWGSIQESKYTVIYSPCHLWNSNLTSDPSDLCEIIKFMKYWKFQTGRHTNHKLLIGTWVTHHHQTFLDQS